MSQGVPIVDLQGLTKVYGANGAAVHALRGIAVFAHELEINLHRLMDSAGCEVPVRDLQQWRQGFPLPCFCYGDQRFG